MNHIVRELIGSVKLLRVSRRPFHPANEKINLQCCKVVVLRNVRSFKYGDTLQRKRKRVYPLFVFHQRLFLTASEEIRGEEFFLYDCRAAINLRVRRFYILRQSGERTKQLTRRGSRKRDIAFFESDLFCCSGRLYNSLIKRSIILRFRKYPH